MASLDEMKKKLEGDKPKIELMNKKENVQKKKGTWGGKREGAGGVKPTKEETLVKRGLKEMIDEYVRGDEEIEITDPKTGQTRKIKKPRIVWAIETFFKFGMAQASKNEVSGITSLKEFTDRAIGKAAQPIRGEGEDDPPIKIGIDIGEILRKAYGEPESD